VPKETQQVTERPAAACGHASICRSHLLESPSKERVAPRPEKANRGSSPATVLPLSIWGVSHIGSFNVARLNPNSHGVKMFSKILVILHTILILLPHFSSRLPGCGNMAPITKIEDSHIVAPHGC